MNNNMPTYYAVLHKTDEIIAENKSFILCMDEARAQFPMKPGEAADYFITTENWFERKPAALQRWANKKATAAAMAKAEAEGGACSVLLDTTNAPEWPGVK